MAAKTIDLANWSRKQPADNWCALVRRIQFHHSSHLGPSTLAKWAPNWPPSGPLEVERREEVGVEKGGQSGGKNGPPLAANQSLAVACRARPKEFSLQLSSFKLQDRGPLPCPLQPDLRAGPKHRPRHGLSLMDSLGLAGHLQLACSASFLPQRRRTICASCAGAGACLPARLPQTGRSLHANEPARPNCGPQTDSLCLLPAGLCPRRLVLLLICFGPKHEPFPRPQTNSQASMAANWRRWAQLLGRFLRPAPNLVQNKLHSIRAKLQLNFSQACSAKAPSCKLKPPQGALLLERAAS